MKPHHHEEIDGMSSNASGKCSNVNRFMVRRQGGVLAELRGVSEEKKGGGGGGGG